MSSNAQRFSGLVGLVPASVLALSLTVFGCGSSEESMEEWESAPAVSPTAMLEYRVDSLLNENRRMQDQLEVVAAENRKLTARNAELETKLADAMAAPQPEATPSQPAPVAGGYDGALSKFQARDYKGAIADFQALLDSGIEASLADNCRYWIGESYYGLRQYRDALKSFQSVVDLPRSGKKADATLMLGNCQLALGNSPAAREAYEKVISDFPASPLVEKARQKLAKIQ
jgi:tol-pal system protein YbgF